MGRAIAVVLLVVGCGHSAPLADAAADALRSGPDIVMTWYGAGHRQLARLTP